MLRDICQQCGAEHEAESGSRFCLDCGADLWAEGRVSSCPKFNLPSSLNQNEEGASLTEEDPAESRKTLIVAAIIALVASVSVFLLFTLVSSCSAGSSDSDSNLLVSEAALGYSDSGSSSSGAATTTTASVKKVYSEPPTTESSLLDLKNQETYHDANLFLSNFAELPHFWIESDYSESNFDDEKVVSWGFWHHGINNGGLLRGSVEVGNAGTYSWNLDTEGTERAIEKYLGLGLDLTGRCTEAYAEEDGRFYLKSNYDESADCNYVALSTKATDFSDDKVEVEFAIVTTSGQYQMVTDSSWYSMSVDELSAAMRQKYKGENVLVATGKAVLRDDDSTKDHSWVLLSMKMDRDKSGDVIWSSKG